MGINYGFGRLRVVLVHSGGGQEAAFELRERVDLLLEELAATSLLRPGSLSDRALAAAFLVLGGIRPTL